MLTSSSVELQSTKPTVLSARNQVNLPSNESLLSDRGEQAHPEGMMLTVVIRFGVKLSKGDCPHDTTSCSTALPLAAISASVIDSTYNTPRLMEQQMINFVLRAMLSGQITIQGIIA